MPIGKYIYCTSGNKHNDKRWRVTNAYRQVHLLYTLAAQALDTTDESQMPIGKYIYCTRHLAPTKWYARSQMPIGKYIYCTCPHNQRTIPGAVVTNAYRQVHLLYLGFLFKKSRHYLQNCRPLQGGLFLGFPSAGETPPQPQGAVVCGTSSSTYIYLRRYSQSPTLPIGTWVSPTIALLCPLLRGRQAWL